MLCKVTVDEPKLPLRKVRACIVSAASVWRKRVGLVETPDDVRLTEVDVSSSLYHYHCARRISLS